MRIALNVLGVLVIFFGVVWFLQGINVLLGSPMSGQMKWAVNGCVAVVLGIVVLWVANRRRSKTRA